MNSFADIKEEKGSGLEEGIEGIESQVGPHEAFIKLEERPALEKGIDQPKHEVKQGHVELKLEDSGVAREGKSGNQALSSSSSASAATDFYIQVKTLAGKTHLIYPRPDDSIEVVKGLVRDKEGAPPDQQRLFLPGKLLDDDDLTLADYDITTTSVLYLVLNLRGMISTFDSIDIKNPISAMLFNNDLKNPPIEMMNEKLGQKCVRTKSYSVEYTGSTLLSEEECKQLQNFMDAYSGVLSIRGHDKDEEVDVKKDFKLVFHEDDARVFNQILGVPGAYEMMSNRLKSSPLYRGMTKKKIKLVLRRSEGPLVGAIPWHVDQENDIPTLQLTLNSDTEYEGGRLCFYNLNEGLVAPSRPAGTLTVHSSYQMHAVTRLISGKRYGIFLLEDSNYGGFRDFFDVDHGVVEDILGEYLCPGCDNCTPLADPEPEPSSFKPSVSSATVSPLSTAAGAAITMDIEGGGGKRKRQETESVDASDSGNVPRNKVAKAT